MRRSHIDRWLIHCVGARPIDVVNSKERDDVIADNALNTLNLKQGHKRLCHASNGPPAVLRS